MQRDELLGALGLPASTAIPPVEKQEAAGDAASISGSGLPEAGKGGEAGTSAAVAPAVPPLPPLAAPVECDGVGGLGAGNVLTPSGQAVTAPQVGNAGVMDAAEADSEERQVYFPKPQINPVVEAIRKRGRYVCDLGGGKHSIACYKRSEHTEPENTSTIYFEPNAGNPAGMLLCQHDHADGVSVLEMLQRLNISYQEARHRSCIRVIPGELSAVILAMEKELAATGQFFHMQGTLVKVSSDAKGNVALIPVTEQTLTQMLATIVDFEKFDGRVKTFVPCDPAPRYVNMLINKREFTELQPINGIARQPYFMQRRGQTVLCTERGYNAASGLLGAFDAKDYALPEPTRENAQAALSLLLGLISEFHFVQPLDRAVALSAIFTAVFRPSIGLAPGFHVRAPVISSGKSFLCEIIGLFADPNGNKKVSYPKGSEEATKSILSALREAPSVIEFDDMTHDWFAHGVINRLFTSLWITDRILGASKMATVSTRTLVLGSGNNVGPIRDLCRRVLTCLLDPRTDSPASLTYGKDPVAMVRKDRAKYVGAVLTVVQAWMAAGSPKSDVSNIASFGGEWSDFCRHPLIWLGQEDPAQAFFEQLKTDPDVEMLGRLLKYWYAAYGAKQMSIRAVMDSLLNHPDLADAISDFPVMERGDINRSKFGWLLKQNANRIVGGLMFQRVANSERVHWQVVSTEPSGAGVSVSGRSTVAVNSSQFVGGNHDDF